MVALDAGKKRDRATLAPKVTLDSSMYPTMNERKAKRLCGNGREGQSLFLGYDLLSLAETTGTARIEPARSVSPGRAALEVTDSNLKIRHRISE
jgi:hypothetical protein